MRGLSSEELMWMERIVLSPSCCESRHIPAEQGRIESLVERGLCKAEPCLQDPFGFHPVPTSVGLVLFALHRSGEVSRTEG
jgi:hypothetical protein